MLSPADISESVEIQRLDDPYYFTSKVISTGSLLTEGEHLYIDKSSDLWKDAMQLLFDKLNRLQEKYNANSIVLRDFHHVDDEFESFLIDNGFFKTSMPETNIVQDMSWNNPEEFYEFLSKKERMHLRKDVRRYQDHYTVSIERAPDENDVDLWYSLYQNVKEHSFDLNTFTLPRKLFTNLANDPSWETLVLKLTTDTCTERTVGIIFSHIAGENYIPMIIGLDYTYNSDYRVYRQALYQLVMRAGSLKKKKVLLGFSAPVEKKKVGAILSPTYAFMQIKDSYNAETLAVMSLAKSSLNK